MPKTTPYEEQLPDGATREGEITTTFKDVAESLSEDPELYTAVKRSVRAEIQEVVLERFQKMTISDLVREAVAWSDVQEVQMLLDQMKKGD